MKIHYTLFIVLLVSVITSCESFIDIGPPRTEIVTETVFTSDASAQSAVRGIYSLMMSEQSFTNGGMEEYGGILSDELISYGSRQELQQFYSNTLLAANGDVLAVFWKQSYRYISNANSMLEGLRDATGMTTPVKQQLEGEAKFIRAFCHFHLVNLFGDIPYLTTTDYRVNAAAARMPVDEVYLLIEQDLLEARDLMAEDFPVADEERVQPGQGAVTALLARLFIYREEWEKAEAESTRLIENTSSYALESDLNNVFLKNSREAIWQLMPVVPGLNTAQGQLFILTTAPNGFSKRVSLTGELYDAFETSDNRKALWTASYTEGASTWYYPFKYKVVSGTDVTEYEMIFRLGEQYLIRAEARAQQDDISGAQDDLNVIRARAGLADTDADDKASLLAALEHERRIELFAEGGHRWADLIRTQRAGTVLGALKPGWHPNDERFPVPESERQLNPNLSQNEGY